MRRLAALVLCLLIPLTATQTPEPSWAPTGKLNQFRGFVTPRPVPPSSEFVYASVWAGWSAWSFCSNGVKIRVRACNTVRGFSCLGRNQEFIPCDGNVVPSPQTSTLPSDYDVVDPYVADRLEAMKQLYPDDFPAEGSSSPPSPNPNFLKIPKAPEHQTFHRYRMHAARSFNNGRGPNRSEGNFSAEKRRQVPESPPGLETLKSSEQGTKDSAHEVKSSVVDEVVDAPPEEKQRQGGDERSVGSHLSQEQMQLQQEELDAALSSLHLRAEGRSSGLHHEQREPQLWQPEELSVVATTTTTTIAQATTEAPVTSTTETPKEVEQEKPGNNLGFNEHEDITKVDFIGSNEFEKEAVLAHHQEIEEESTTTTSEPEISGEIFEDDEHFQQFGTRPEIVEPKLDNGNGIDDDLLPEIVTPFEPEPLTIPFTTTSSTTTTTTMATTTTTTPMPSTAEQTTRTTTTTDEPLVLIEAPDVINIVTTGERQQPLTSSSEFKSYGVSKMLPETIVKKKKIKGFGFTGFAMRKAFDKKRFIHEGAVEKKPLVIRVKEPKKEPTVSTQELSSDTLHALDWMLQNITRIAEQGDESFMKALSFNSDEQDSIEGSTTTPPMKVNVVKPKELSKTKTKKHRKVKKIRKGMSKQRKDSRNSTTVMVHSGEFRPKFAKKKGMFPKFRTRVTATMRARSFGVRMVNDDKDTRHTHNAEDVDEKEANPVKLLEEIADLEDMMSRVAMKASEAYDDPTPEDGPNFRSSRQQLQKQQPFSGQTLDTTDIDLTTRESHPFSYGTESTSSPAMDLSLVPLEKGFVPMAGQMQEQFHQQPIHLLTAESEAVGDTRWSEWSIWGECFCERQVRTRRCIYTGAMSQGCEGSSYESRNCFGGSCPIAAHPVTTPQPTLATEPTESPEDAHRRLRPLKLHTATSLS